MNIQKLLFFALIAAFSITSFSQVTVTTNSVKYERKGADVLDWKRNFEVDYPKFGGIEDIDTLKKLEETFSYWRVFGSSLEEEMEYQWLESLEYKVNYNKNGIIELALTRSGTGAYPSGETRTIVANVSTGMRIEMTDTFKDRIRLLTEIDKKQQDEITLGKKENKEYNQTDGSEFDEVSKASDSVREFSVGDLGVTFLYDYGFPHVIKALQPPGRFFFTWKEIAPFLQKYGALETAEKNAPTMQNTVAIVDLSTGGVLGGVAAGNFVNGETAGKLFANDSRFVVIDPTRFTSGAKVNAMNAAWKVRLRDEQPEEICPGFSYSEITPNTKKGIAIGANADWNVIPRIVTDLGSNNKLYEAEVGSFLKTKRLKNPVVKIEQLYKVDLEGDGVDEVVISARHFSSNETEGFADKDSYSFIMVRKVVDGKPRNILLTGEFVAEGTVSMETRHEISAIADLNGDGIMEITIFGRYHEGEWATAYQISGGEAVTVLEVGCGL